MDVGFGVGFCADFCGHIRYFRRRCRPVPPLRRLTFVLSKVSKTAGSHIRPYASLRVPSLRCPPGAARPTTCFAKSTTRALRLRRRGLRPSPFRTPPLGLLKSQVTGGALTAGSSKSKAVRTARCASVSVFDLAFALDARESRRRQLRLQPAEWRCL